MSKGRELADYLADILAALTEVDQFIAGPPNYLGLSQNRSAALFGLSARTVRNFHNWEQGGHHPEGPARILLQEINREPEAVMRALRG